MYVKFKFVDEGEVPTNDRKWLGTGIDTVRQRKSSVCDKLTWELNYTSTYLRYTEQALIVDKQKLWLEFLQVIAAWTTVMYIDLSNNSTMLKRFPLLALNWLVVTDLLIRPHQYTCDIKRNVIIVTWNPIHCAYCKSRKLIVAGNDKEDFNIH